MPEAGITLRPYKTKDGYLAQMAPQQDEFIAICKGLGAAELANDPRFSTLAARSRHPKELRAILEPLFGAFNTDELLARMLACDAPVGKVNMKAEVITDPQVVHNQALVEIDQGALGRVRVARAAAKFDAVSLPVPKAAPHLGEHGKAVLRELGYDEAHIDTLVRTGVLGAA